jgi:hypothetical protein
MTATKLKIALESLIDSKIPCFIWGEPGVGKSSLVSQIAKQKNMDFIDLRLSLLDPTDLRGIPFFNSEEKSAVWAKPEFFPKSCSKEFGILFLDEINSAPPTIQAAAYQLILDRKIGEYTLPKNYAIVAAGNKESSKGITYRMHTPLANRFVHLNFDLDFDSWKTWAYQNNIDYRIISYLNYKQENLFLFDPSSSKKAFATPRSWSFVNDILNSDLHYELYYDVISGTIGEQSASEFLNFIKVMDKIPNIDDILNQKSITIPTNNSVLYALCTGLVYAVKQNNSIKHIDTILKFSFNLSSEFSVILVRDMQTNGINIEHSALWDKWVEKHSFLL